jgi:hypothetical protein
MVRLRGLEPLILSALASHASMYIQFHHKRTWVIS